MATESATPRELLAQRVVESCSTPDTHSLIFNATQGLLPSSPVHGVVVYGDQRGRQLGFPTANVPVDYQQDVPTDGVYAGWLRRMDTRDIYPAAISVGTNPTFEGVRDRRIESYVLDRTDLELYGVAVEISFVAHVRDVESFDSIEGLIEQMGSDVDTIRKILVGADYVAQDV
ncbi:riboflavin kinase [Rhodococcus sp. OK302]|uniref:riboflavin kinase n=1 Tax=Rhodococcus sp. OK302 TaxID=1882769 RepID=UPI001C3D0183|nr:riboflavin kinase [Rhodococcus sp. OK302]